MAREYVARANIDISIAKTRASFMEAVRLSQSMRSQIERDVAAIDVAFGRIKTPNITINVDSQRIKAELAEITQATRAFRTEVESNMRGANTSINNAIRIRTPRGFGQFSNTEVQQLLNNAPNPRPLSSFGRYSLYNASNSLNQAIPRGFGQSSNIGLQSVFNDLPKPSLLQNIARQFNLINQEIKQYANTDLGRVASSLNSTVHAMQNLSIISGVLGGFGIREAQNLQRQNALLTVFTRTQARRVETEQQIRDYAEATNQAYLTSLESANSILPTVNRYRVDMQEVLSIVQRLAILDPAQGTQGAAFAIREALSGQGRSLAARFELSLSQVNGIISRAGGDPQKVIEGLNELVNQLGLTKDQFLQLQNSGVNTLQRLGDTVREAVAVAFTPALQNVIIPLAERVIDLLNTLNNTSPALLAIAGTGALVVAGMTPVLFIVGQLVAAYNALAVAAGRASAAQLAGAGAGAGGSILSRGLGALGGLAGSAGSAVSSGIGAIAPWLLATVGGLGAGAVGGTLIGQGLANAGYGDERLRVDSGKNPFTVLLDTAKKAIISFTFLVGDGAIEVGRVLAKLGIRFLTSGDYIQSMITEAGATVSNALLLVAGGLLGIMDDLFSILPFGLGEGFRGAIAGIEALMTIGISANNNTIQEERVRRENWDNSPAMIAADAVVDTFFDGMRDSFYDWIAVAAGLDTHVESIFNNIRGIGEAAGGIFGEIRNQVTSNLAPNLRRGGEEAAIISQEREIALARQREQEMIQMAREEFDYRLGRSRALADFERSRGREAMDFDAQRQRQLEDFNAEMLKSDEEYRSELLELESNYAKDELKRAEDFGKELARIERETRENVLNAARRLDASGVRDAYRSGAQQLADATERYNDERDERQSDYAERIEELRLNNEEQRDERIRSFERQQADQLAQYNLQRQRQLEDFTRRLQDEDFDRAVRRSREIQDRAIRDRIEQEEYNKRINDLWSRLNKETSMWSNFTDSIGASFGRLRDAIAASIPEQFRLDGGKSYVPINNGTKTRGYAMGGIPPLNTKVLVGELGPELVSFPSTAYINRHNSPATQNALRGGGGNTLVVDLSGMVVNFDDPYLPALIRDRVYDTITDIFSTYRST